MFKRIRDMFNTTSGESTPEAFQFILRGNDFHFLLRETEGMLIYGSVTSNAVFPVKNRREVFELGDVHDISNRFADMDIEWHRAVEIDFLTRTEVMRYIAKHPSKFPEVIFQYIIRNWKELFARFELYKDGYLRQGDVYYWLESTGDTNVLDVIAIGDVELVHKHHVEYMSLCMQHASAMAVFLEKTKADGLEYRRSVGHQLVEPPLLFARDVITDEKMPGSTLLMYIIGYNGPNWFDEGLSHPDLFYGPNGLVRGLRRKGCSSFRLGDKGYMPPGAPDDMSEEMLDYCREIAAGTRQITIKLHDDDTEGYH